MLDAAFMNIIPFIARYAAKKYSADGPANPICTNTTTTAANKSNNPRILTIMGVGIFRY